jgi:hypothetical protein
LASFLMVMLMTSYSSSSEIKIAWVKFPQKISLESKVRERMRLNSLVGVGPVRVLTEIISKYIPSLQRRDKQVTRETETEIENSKLTPGLNSVKKWEFFCSTVGINDLNFSNFVLFFLFLNKADAISEPIPSFPRLILRTLLGQFIFWINSLSS